MPQIQAQARFHRMNISALDERHEGASTVAPRSGSSAPVTRLMTDPAFARARPGRTARATAPVAPAAQSNAAPIPEGAMTPVQRRTSPRRAPALPPSHPVDDTPGVATHVNDSTAASSGQPSACQGLTVATPKRTVIDFPRIHELQMSFSDATSDASADEPANEQDVLRRLIVVRFCSDSIATPLYSQCHSDSHLSPLPV